MTARAVSPNALTMYDINDESVWLNERTSTTRLGEEGAGQGVQIGEVPVDVRWPAARGGANAMRASRDREAAQRGPSSPREPVVDGDGAPTPIATLHNSTWMTSPTTPDIASAEPHRGTLEDVDYTR